MAIFIAPNWELHGIAKLLSGLDYFTVTGCWLFRSTFFDTPHFAPCTTRQRDAGWAAFSNPCGQIASQSMNILSEGLQCKHIWCFPVTFGSLQRKRSLLPCLTLNQCFSRDCLVADLGVLGFLWEIPRSTCTSLHIPKYSDKFFLCPKLLRSISLSKLSTNV